MRAVFFSIFVIDAKFQLAIIIPFLTKAFQKAVNISFFAFFLSIWIPSCRFAVFYTILKYCFYGRLFVLIPLFIETIAFIIVVSHMKHWIPSLVIFFLIAVEFAIEI